MKPQQTGWISYWNSQQLEFNLPKIMYSIQSLATLALHTLILWRYIFELLCCDKMQSVDKRAVQQTSSVNLLLFFAKKAKCGSFSPHGWASCWLALLGVFLSDALSAEAGLCLESLCQGENHGRCSITFSTTECWNVTNITKAMNFNIAWTKKNYLNRTASQRSWNQQEDKIDCSDNEKHPVEGMFL